MPLFYLHVTFPLTAPTRKWLVTRFVHIATHNDIPVKVLDEIVEEKLEIIPDKQLYRIGETAELIIRCPFAPCNGM